MTLPDEPGAYLDGGGDVWIRTVTGVWIDALGKTPNPMTDEAREFLRKNGPYTPMPRGVDLRHEYRVVNEADNFQSATFPLLEEAELWVEKKGDTLQERVTIEVPWLPVSGESAEDTDVEE